MKRAYISGPMRGHCEFNFPSFHKVAYELSVDGWEVYSPAAHDLDVCPGLPWMEGFAEGDMTKLPGLDLSASFTWDIESVLAADAIFMLPGWADSVGARAERLVAELTGKDVWLAVREPHGEWSFKADNKKRVVTSATVEAA